MPIFNQRLYDLESLEQRLLLSADGFGLGSIGQDREDPCSRIETVVEVEDTTRGSLDTRAHDSIYGDFEVEVTFAADEEEHSADVGILPEKEEDPDVITQNNSCLHYAGTGAQTLAAVAGVQVQSVETGATNAAQGESDYLGIYTVDPELANTTPQLLTETLTAANPPPAGMNIGLDVDGRSVISITSEYVQNYGNQLVIHEGETLKGSWTADVSVVMDGGKVSPGNSPGIQNVATYTNTSGELEIEIAGTGGAGAVNGHDRLNVSGLATMGGSSRMRIVLLGGYVPAVGASFAVMTWGSRSGEFENYLGTASIGSDRAFTITYNANNLVLTVVNTPGYNPIKADIENLIDKLSDVGDVLDTAGDFAEILPLIGDNVGNLLDVGKAIRDVLYETLNNLSGVLSVADVTEWIEDFEGQVVLGYTMHVEGVLATYGATIANPVRWDVDIYFEKSSSFNYNLADDVAFGGTLASTVAGTVSTRLDLDFSFGKDATGFYVGLEEFKACVSLNSTPSLTLNFNSPLSAGVTANGTVLLEACIALTPNASILSSGKIYLSTLTGLGDGSSSVISNFTWTPTASINADLQLSFSSINLFGGATLSAGVNGRLQINGSDLFNVSPDFDIYLGGATLNFSGALSSLPAIQGNFNIRTDGVDTFLLVDITQLRLSVGVTRIVDMTGSVSLSLGDDSLAGKADLTLANGPALPNLTLTGGTWHLELNTGNTTADVLYNGDLVTLPAGPYVRIEGDGTGLGFTINPTFTLLGNFVFERSSAAIVKVAMSEVSFEFTDGTNDLISITEGQGGLLISSAGVAGTLEGTFSEAIPVVDITGTFGVTFNTTGAAVATSFSVDGETIDLDVPAGSYLRVTGEDAVMEILGIGVSGNFIFENRETSTGGERVITVSASEVNFEMGDLSTDLVTLSNGAGSWIISNAGVAGTASIDYTVDVFGIAAASGTGTLTINQLATAVSETVDVMGVSVSISAPAGPYLRLDTTATTLTILDSAVTGNFSYEEKTTADGDEVVSVAATGVSVSLKQGGTTLMQLTGGSGYFIFSDDGVAGSATGTVTEFLPFITGLTVTGSFSLAINTTDEAVNESYTLAGVTQTVDVPEGPYLKITGDNVGIALSVGGGIGSVTVTGDFGFEQKTNATTHQPEYIMIGATDVDVTLTAVGIITIVALDGEGAFVLKTSGFAGEATMDSFVLGGAASFLTSVIAENMVFRINTTGADVNETVSVSSTEDVELEFTGSYYHNYVGISGAVTVNLLNFADFSGNLSFELFDPGGGKIVRIAAEDVTMGFNLGGAELVTFHNGTGAFVITSAGLAGVASLQFQTGFVNVSGTIDLEINTTLSAASYSWTAPDASTFSFNLTETDYLRICVNGSVGVGTLTIPVNFTIEETAGNLYFYTKGGSPVEIFHLEPDGDFVPGTYWTSLGLGADFDFANPSPEEILTFLQRLGNWFNLLGNSSLFDVEIPFTDGTTLGEAVDWVQGFVDLFYSKLVSTEVALALPVPNLPAAGAYSGSFSVTFAGSATVYAVTFNGNYNTGWAGLEAAIDAGLSAALISTRLDARMNRDGVLSIAFTEQEIKNGTTGFSITLGSGAFVTLGTPSVSGGPTGFPVTVNSQTISRYLLEEFPEALSTILGLGTPIEYDDQQKLYIFPVNLNLPGSTYSVDFDWAAEIGPLGSATLSGQMDFTPALNFNFSLGLDLNPSDIPRIFSSQFIPAPSNGRITQTASFKLYLNNSAAPITVTLNKFATTTNTTLAHLADDLNAALSAAADYTPPGGVATDLLQFVRFQAAGTVLVLSGVNEDLDFDGKRDAAEDTNLNGYLDAGEDDDGDGNLDVAELDWDGDSILDNQTGFVTQIRLTVDQYDTFATELGFGDTIEYPIAAYPNGFFESVANAPMKGFFMEDVNLSATLEITTPGEITGKLVFGFLELTVNGGKVESRDPFEAPDALMATVGIRDPTTGNDRFYMPELMDVFGDIGTYIEFNLAGGVYAGFDNISAGIGGNSVLSGGELSVWIPILTELNYNENTYDVNNDAANKGIFLTYPDVGLRGGFSFEEISFTDIIRGLEAVVDTLDDFSAFGFLDEPIPFINLSLHDLVDYAGQFADLVDAVSEGDSDNIQEMLVVMEEAIEDLFNLDPEDFWISFDTNGINYTNGVASDVITHSGTAGTAGAASWVNFDPNGNNNGFRVQHIGNGTQWNGTLLRIKGSSTISGNDAAVEWDQVAKIITILIDPTNTTAATIVNEIHTALAGQWDASLLAGNDGTGKIRTNALKFHWDYTAAYVNELPLHLDLADLLAGLGGDNPQVQGFLSAVSSVLHVSGSGMLNVSASAEVELEFGLDLTDPTTVTPFIYDTTSVDLKAKVSVTDLEFEAAVGALGVFIRDGELVFDYDGDGGATNSTESAIISLGFKNLDGDARHYFDSSLLSLDSFSLTAHAGITAVLPLYAPVDSLPVGLSTLDANGDGFADNALAVDIPDLVRLLMGDKTARYTTTAAEHSSLIFRGAGNDLNLDLNVAAVTGGLSGVKVKFSDTGSLSASYNPGSNEVTFGFDNAATTALELVDFVIAQGGILSTSTSHPVDGMTLSLAWEAGTPVPLAKITIAAPDFGGLFDDMDLCEIIDAAAGPLLDGLDGTLEDIQNALNEVVLNTKLPLIGDALSGAANFIEDFRNGLLAELRTRIQAANGSAIGALEDAIKEAIWNVLGNEGLGLLVNFETGEAFGEDATFEDLDVTLDCNDGLQVNLRMSKTLALLDTTQNPIDFDIGVDGFGLQVDGNVVLALGFDLRLVFGFNKTDGFWLGTEGGMEDPELQIGFEATIPGLHAGGELFFLRLDVKDDPENPSFFKGGFFVDLMDPNDDGKLTWSELTSAEFEDIIAGELSAEADINLDIAASFDGNAAFPRLLADFHLGWEWSLGEGASDPVIEFNNLRLDLGSFISDVLGPILEEVQKITQPLQPIIDIATMDLPILSQLAGKSITFLDLAQGFGYLDPETRDFIEDVLMVIELINGIPTGNGSVYIPLGAFSMIAGEDGAYDTNPLGNLSKIDLNAELGNLGSDSTAGSTQVTQTAGFVDGANAMDGFKLPWLENPSEIFGLFVGKPVRLFEWQLPTFAFEFTYTQKIPIFPPLYAQFGGTIGAYIDIGFGFDTYGIQKFIEGGAKDVLEIFDGFYIADYDENGNERPELTLLGEIFAGVSLSIGPAEVGVEGGIGVTVEFDLNDIEEDGRVRVSELIANAQIDPRCIFDIHGEVYLFLEAFLKVDLFFFQIDETWRFGEFLLFSFDITCPEPKLGEVNSSGVLQVNAGVRAEKRAEIDTNDGNETFVIKHLEGTAGAETVEIQWGDYRETFSGFTSIEIDMGEGNDYIDLSGVLTTVTVRGGAGSDTIILGAGLNSIAYGDDGDDKITAGSHDTIAVTGVKIYGGNGADVLTAGKNALSIYGDGGSDKIYGSSFVDTLEGGDGSDLIYGYDGLDTINGGAGNDDIYAGAGNDVIDAGDGDDLVEAGLDNDRVIGGSGNDEIYGSEGNDLIMGGAGDDRIYGHGGVDLLVGDDFNMAAFTVGMMNALADSATAGGTYNITGITGEGDDFIVGGGGFDVMFGGDGDDFLFGGNYFSGGATQLIEEDDNDFIDGGVGNDEIFGDDSYGKAGERVTGISVEGVVFHDLNLSNLYDGQGSAADRPLPGVTVELFKGSDDSRIGVTVTDSAGRWKFSGLDPNDYYLEFTGPAGYTLVNPDSASALGLDDVSEPDNDSDVVVATHQTGAFQLDYDEEETSITAGYYGDPTLTVTNEAVLERADGQVTTATFTVKLSGPSAEAIILDYFTVDGTDDTPAYGSALAADNDYEAVLAGVLTFAPGEMSKTITIQINGDSTYERHEGFDLKLTPRLPSQLATSPSSITTQQTIINDDVIPSISITDVTTVEPTATGGNALAIFKVRLSNYHYDGVVTVDYQTTDATLIDGSTSDRSATAGGANDYVTLAPATLTFGAGELEKFITVEIKGDDIDEYDESFYVNLFNPAFATISDDRGYGIILDTDAAPVLSITPVIADGDLDGQSTTVNEGNYLTQGVTFDVTVTGKTSRTVTVTWDAARGTALPGFGDEIVGDFENNATSSETESDSDTTLTFSPNGSSTNTKQISVWVHGDFDVEGDEHFYVNLLTADGATIVKNHVTVKIIDDDAAGVTGSPYDVRFARSYFEENETDGSKFAYITLVRTPGPTQAYAVLTVTGGTAKNTPEVKADFSMLTSQLVVFAANEYVKLVPVLILGDTRNEADETITFGLRRPTGAPANGNPGTATLTIVDDDDVSIMVEATSTGHTEGNGGLVQHTFQIKLVDPENPAQVRETEQIITFEYRTIAITATGGGVDYNGTGLTPWQFDSSDEDLPKIVTVHAKGDTDPEYAEVFRLKVSNVVGAGTYQPQDDAVIVDDDTVEVDGYVFIDTNQNGYWDEAATNGFTGVSLNITDSSGVPQLVTTDLTGRYSAFVLLGTVKIEIVETGVIEGWELTTENDSQQEDWDGSAGISPFTAIGYRLPLTFTLPVSADTVGRGATDDTIFGGPGNDYIDAGGGDDHVVGGHWQTATDINAPINLGTYDARVIARYIVTTEINDPQTAPIWEVDASVGAGTGSVTGNIFKDTNDSSRQDEGLYFSEVIVTLLDCESNVINIQATNTGLYLFQGLYAGTYYVQFSLPQGQQFVAANVGDDFNDSDAAVAGATAMMSFGSGEAKINVDTGLEELGSLPSASTSTVEFGQTEFHVTETADAVLVTMVRSNATTAEAVVWFGSNGTALEGVNYTGVQGVVMFAAGETIANFEIPILSTYNDNGTPDNPADDTGLLACDVLDFSLSIRRPTGQPIRGGEANVYVHGQGSGSTEDNDEIRGGDDWDIILGDSGNIPAIVIFADLANGLIDDNAGLGHDTIYGDDSADYVNGQLGDDFLAGGEGEDFIYGGYGDDRILVELDDDDIFGEHGTDTVYGSSNRNYIMLDGNAGVVPAELRFGKARTPDTADSEFNFDSIEAVELFGTSADEVFIITNWGGELFVFGNDGSDVLEIKTDLPSITVSDTSALQQWFYQVFFGFNVEANVVLSSGEAYHFGEMETVKLAGQGSDNIIDASAYSGDVIFDGGAGNDTLIGGTGDDTFFYDTDSALGTDTVTGNGGTDMLDFSGTSSVFTVTVNLGTIGSVQVVNANLSLTLTAEDIEGATGGSGDDELTGNSLDNLLIGGPGNDTLIGRAGSETYSYDIDSPWGDDTIVENSGDAGHDIIDFSATTTQTITLNLATGTMQTVNVSLNLRLTLSGGGIDEVIGGSLNDSITGDSNSNTLRGGPGDDTLYAAGGDDFLDGGTGTDLLDGGADNDSISSTANSNFTLNDGQLIRNGGDLDNLFSIEWAELIGGASNNTFTLTGWCGDVTINGMGGNDRIVFAGDMDMVLSTAGSTDLLVLNGGLQKFAADNVERWTLTGGVSSNTIDASLYTRAGGFLTLSGSGDNDAITGSLNDDLINGGAGDDTLSGGAGFDTINGGTGSDTITESGFTTFYVTSAGLLINRGGAVSETDSLDSVEVIDADGGAGSQTFVFTGTPTGLTSVSFDGAAGTGDLVGVIWNGSMTFTSATMNLGAGTPAFNLAGLETLIVFGSAGNDLINAAGWTSGSVFVTAGEGNDEVIGGSGKDELYGGNGDDILAGGGDDDILNGGDTSASTDDGDDTYFFDTDNSLGVDTISDDGGEDTLNFSATTTLGHTVNLMLNSNPVNANLTINWLAGVLIENLVGGSLVDNFTGDANANEFTGNGGGDFFTGGDGNDTYFLDVDSVLGSDTITDSAGIDTIDFSATAGVNLTLNLNTAVAQVVHALNLALTLGVSVIENVTGGEGNDSITGNLADNVLTGNGGKDTLLGGNGDDILAGGGDDDTLNGGDTSVSTDDGDDTYFFDTDNSLGEDTISDDGGEDTLNFSATTTLGHMVNLTLFSNPVNANLTINWLPGVLIENLVGGSGNDTLTGNSVVNVFTGNAGNDTINGSVSGDDRISETRDANFEIKDVTAVQALLTVNGSETDTLNNIHYVTLNGGASDNTFDASDFGSLAHATANFLGRGGDDTFIGGGHSGLSFIGAMNFTGGSGDDTYVFDMALRSLNIITEGTWFSNNLHDTIIGAGGGLVNLTISNQQTPDIINYPHFKIKFTSAFSVEHTL